MGLYDITAGIPLAGVFFNTFLYGVVAYQFAAYHHTKFNDPPTTRYMVFFLFILDTFYSVSVVYMAWSYLVTNHDNPAALSSADWPHTLTPLATALGALVTQTCLGVRIKCLTGNKFLYCTIILLAFISFILGMVCSIKVWIIKLLTKIPRTAHLAVAWLSMQVITDTLITIALIIFFSRSRTGFRKTDTVLNRLIRGAIQTGLLPALFAVGDLITFITCPETNLYVMFAIPIGRIYTNTLLDSLLVREWIRAEMYGTCDANELRTGCADRDAVQASSVRVDQRQT